MIVPTFTRSLQETTARENEHIEFEVEVGGSPLPQIKWFKDNKEIDSNDKHFEQKIDKDGKAKLVIKDSAKADAGKYKCEATNDAGTASSEAPLKILTGEEKQTGKGETAPEFSQQLKPAHAKEGETVVFDCKYVQFYLATVSAIFCTFFFKEKRAQFFAVFFLFFKCFAFILHKLFVLRILPFVISG